MKCPISLKRCRRKCIFWDQCKGTLSKDDILKLEIILDGEIYTGKKFMDNLNNPNFLRDMEEP